MNFKKFRNFNWIEMDSKDQNLDLTRTKWIHFCLFQSIFVCWAVTNLCSNLQIFNVLFTEFHVSFAIAIAEFLNYWYSRIFSKSDDTDGIIYLSHMYLWILFTLFIYSFNFGFKNLMLVIVHSLKIRLSWRHPKNDVF